MGFWTAVIHGHGIHHNGRADDAEAMLAHFVGELKAAGHEIEHAALTVGMREAPDETAVAAAETAVKAPAG